jgi:hypothetical protein
MARRNAISRWRVGVEARGCLRLRQACRRPRQHAKPEVAALEELRRVGIDPRERGSCHRDVRHLADVGAGEAAGAHADNHDRNAAYDQRFANSIGAAREVAFPVSVADHGNQRRADLVIHPHQQTAAHRIKAKRLVVIAGDEGAGHVTNRAG